MKIFSAAALYAVSRFLVFYSLINAVGADVEYPDVNRNTSEIIASRGYRVITHEITTEDGYILTYYQILQGKAGKPVTKGSVLIQHGLLSTSYDWFIQNEDKTLPFLLAEEGYDVWIGNARGTSYSDKHVNLTTSDPAYWRFCWEDMGKYDIPAAIDYILLKSGDVSLPYIGHSMGTTQFFVMSMLKPEYNSKIRLMTAFAPVAFVSNMKSPLRALGPVALTATITDLGDLATEIGSGKQLPGPLLDAIHKYAPYVCSPEMATRLLCETLIFVVMGFDPKQMNDTKLPVTLAHFPDSSSVRAMIHYGQEINTGRFARFDYGIFNIVKYGRLTPPSFNPQLMNVPIAFYWGENDFLADSIDVAYFANMVPNLVRNYSVPYPEFNHIDFLTAIDAYDLLYKTTIEFMNQF